MRAAQFLLLAMLLAGCAAKPAVSSDPLPDVEGVSGLLHMEECSGALAYQYHALGTNPAEPPAGWGEHDGLNRVVMWIWSCGSVGFAELERPATMLWEVTHNASAPDACFGGGGEVPWFIVNVLVDEPGLADRMRVEGLPVEMVTFERLERTTGAIWYWGDGSADSSMEWFSEGGRTLAHFGPTRWLAPTTDGVVVMDLVMTYRWDMGPDRAAIGDLAPRHRLGFDGRFLGTGALTTDGTITMDVEQRGVDCA